jgi:hypothetical protein
MHMQEAALVVLIYSDVGERGLPGGFVGFNASSPKSIASGAPPSPHEVLPQLGAGGVPFGGAFVVEAVAVEGCADPRIVRGVVVATLASARNVVKAAFTWASHSRSGERDEHCGGIQSAHARLNHVPSVALILLRAGRAAGVAAVAAGGVKDPIRSALNLSRFGVVGRAEQLDRARAVAMTEADR